MKRKLLLNLAWAAFLAALSIPAWTADIPGVVLEPGMPSSAGIESDEGFNCLAVIYPYSTWQPNVNSSDTQPTPSPVPPYVEGAIDFSITNVGANPVRAPWTLGIYNPVYTQVLQVLSPLTPPSVTYSVCQRIAWHVPVPGESVKDQRGNCKLLNAGHPKSFLPDRFVPAHSLCVHCRCGTLTSLMQRKGRSSVTLRPLTKPWSPIQATQCTWDS